MRTQLSWFRIFFLASISGDADPVMTGQTQFFVLCSVSCVSSGNNDNSETRQMSVTRPSGGRLYSVHFHQARAQEIGEDDSGESLTRSWQLRFNIFCLNRIYVYIIRVP
jgi:hypothetical protein